MKLKLDKFNITLASLLTIIALIIVHINHYMFQHSIMIRHIILISLLSVAWYTFKDYFKLKKELENIKHCRIKDVNTET